MLRRFCLFLILLSASVDVSSQTALQRSKLSPMLRQMMRLGEQRDVTAFLRISGDGDEVLRRHGCRQLARVGDIYIANIPAGQLNRLAAEGQVRRIEANRSREKVAHTDTMAIILNATKVYEGVNLPQAYTGKGVVMGLMDIGFDLTHPVFFSNDGETYRVKAFWDQLSKDTVGSVFPVGRDYTTEEALLNLGHSVDGLDFTHGTGSASIAAGSAAGTRFQGMAPESDLCLVANAVRDDIVYIDSADIEKYTFATDALGFKYIFDYAQAHGQSCVVSLSEGSGQDFWGYDQLYYAMLDSLTGPGRIIVASAGNTGYMPSYFHKPRGRQSDGCFLRSGRSMTVTMKSSDDFDIRMVAYTSAIDTIVVSTREALSAEDSVFTQVCALADDHWMSIILEAYPSCYDETEMCYDITLESDVDVGYRPRLSFEVMGQGADVEVYRVNGEWRTNELNPQLQAGESSYSVHSPGSSPGVICVGATSYRDGIMNVRGEWHSYWGGRNGVRTAFSSKGPTYDGRIKPDVMAPGNHIVQALNSFVVETHPNTSELDGEQGSVDFRGKRYYWTTNTGTSSSAPAVGGAIALWLQAKPDLTTQEALAVIARTSHHYDPQLDYPNNEYGYGEIDVYAGLLDLLGLNKIKDISLTQTKVRIRPEHGHRLHLELPEQTVNRLRMRVYSTDGRCVFSTELPSGQPICTVQLPDLPSGVYAVQIDGEASLCGSELVRL